MADMIKFYKGLEASLPAAGTNGALYITTDEGAIYLGTGTGMKRLGDFVQVANVAALPAKAHENCLYYCVAENILAKWNGTEWKQVNKQPTTEELKTLLGLGSLAYKSEVAEGDLSTALKEKVNAAAEGNHSHSNKALLDTYTQTEANLADAVAKKHAHANADELAKIADGDKAKWDAVVADYLTSADKTTLENSIKDAKKAGTDANTALETYKVSNDARVKAVEDDIAEIVDGTNGVLAQAKSYSDGKLATARTEITAEIDGDVKVVADALAEYKTANDGALAGVKATAEAAAVKTEVESALAGKVDKVEGKSLVDDAEIAKLAGVSEGANKVEASTNGKIKIDGVDTTVYVHPDKHTVSEISDFETKIASYDYATKTEAKGYADAKDETIAAAQKAADDLAVYVGTFTASEGVDTVVKYIDAKTANIASDERVDGIDERLTQAEKDIDAIEADYLKAADKTELEGKITAEKQRAEGIEGGLRTDVDAIKGDYLKAADKTELEGKITAEETRATGVESGLDARIKAVEGDYLKASDKEDLQTQINTIMNNPDTEGVINSINEFTQYIADHGAIADGFRTDIDKNKEDIAANAKAIEDHETLAAQTYETKEDATAKYDEVKAEIDAIPQADWNQNDATAADYVKNRTHYESAVVTELWTDAVFTTGSELDKSKFTADGVEYDTSGYVSPITGDYAYIALQPGDEYEIVINGVSYRTIYSTSGFEIDFAEGRLPVKFGSGGMGTMLVKSKEPNKTYTITVRKIEGSTIKQLDEKFIPDTIARTSAVDSVDARVQTLEAIDHDAYVAADSALKTELQAEIDADVKALADGQVKTNTEAIATKANAADVYAKTETFTKEEVAAAIEAAVTEAHTWGSF